MKHVRHYIDMACFLPAVSLILSHCAAKAMIELYGKFIGGK